MKNEKDLVKEAQSVISKYIHRLRARNVALIYKAYNTLHKKHTEHKTRAIINKKMKKTLNYLVFMLTVILISLIMYAISQP